jgi:elongation factor P
MLSLNEIKIGKVLQITNDPYVVVKADHHKMGRGGAVLKTKLKNLLNGNMIEKTWQGNDKADEAQVEKKKADYLYKDETFAYFMDNETFEQFSIPLDQLGEQDKFLKENTEVNVLYFQDSPMSVTLPIKIELKVVSAPPGVKGNSVSNTLKLVELETGAKINVPMFIEEGDVIRINTETGEYTERA